jgi:two-component system cell cycle sensor histidine kinase/response regulator CckA
LREDIALRLVGVLLLVFAVIGLSGVLILLQLNDKIAERKIDDTIQILQARTREIERRWQIEADVFHNQLEFSRVLDVDDARILHARFTAFVTSFGGSGVFTHAALISPSGAVLASYRTRSQQELKLPSPLDATPAWIFGAQDNTLYRALGVPVLIAGRRARLIVYAPLDNALMARNVMPDTRISLAWQGKIIAESVPDSATLASATNRDVNVTRRVVWGNATQGPELEIQARVVVPFSIGDMLLFVGSTMVLIALLGWLVLGRWLAAQLRRVKAVASAIDMFSRDQTVTGKVKYELERASSGKQDELGDLSNGTGNMMLALMREKKRLDTILQTASDGIHILDSEGKLIEANDAFLDLLGYDKSAIGRLRVGDWDSQDAPSIILERNKGLMDNKSTKVFETRHKRIDGRIVDVEINARGIEIEGTPFLYAASRDITERKQAEAERVRLAAIVENSNDAIYSRTLDGTILSWNAGAEKLLGFTAAEAIGKSIDLMRLPGRPSSLENINEQLLRGDSVVHETDRKIKDGRVINVRASHSPLRDSNSHIIGASIILQDITALKQAEAARAVLEAQLRESQKMEAVGTLAGGIAHDFNNIIATILGNAELASLDATGNPAVLDSLEEIRKAGRRARDVVQQILAFSRRQPAAHKSIALAPVIDESVRLLRSTISARVAIESHCAADVPAVRADVTQIEQVIINLATNAMYAMQGQRGQISIRLDTVLLDAGLADTHPQLRALYQAHPGRTVRIAVSDTGSGMDKETLGRIFEPFFTTKPVGEGTGLGLSVVHGIVQSHGGAIMVDSTVGEGTTFTIYLPLAKTQAAAPADIGTLPPAPKLIGGQRILYLDDDEGLVYLVTRLLGRSHYRVSGFSNQGEALAAVRADPAAFDLVVIDYNMPGMSGLDVAREVRTIRADLPVAVASGFVDEALQAQASASGVREVIFKATAVEELSGVIARLAQAVGEKSKAS